MTVADPIDLLRDLLAGHVDPAVLNAAIADVRAQFGGDKAYIHSNTRDRVAALRADLARGIALADVSTRYRISRQNLYYHRRKIAGISLLLF